MLSQVQHVNNEQIIQNWHLGDLKGIPFENHIYRVLLRHMEEYQGKVLVYDTPSSRDDGKDIIIKSTTDIHDLMGHNFYLRDFSEITIYIECKSSDNDNISWNQLAGNIARIENDNIQYYVVVTNTTLVPYTYYQFAKSAKEKNIDFYLVDQTLLIPYLLRQNACIGQIGIEEKLDKIYSEYQVLSYERDMQTYFEVYLLVRNYKTSTEKIRITLGTDHDWAMSPSEVDIALEENHFRCIKFIANRKYYDGINQLNIVLQLNDLRNVIEVKGMNLDFDFIPALFGKQHYEVLDELSDLAVDSTTYQVRYLFGESGCGKSRIIEELYKKTLGRNISVITIRCTHNESNLKQKLVKSLSEQRLVGNIRKNATLSSIICQIETSYQKCVLIIDNIHNLDENTLNELKKAVAMNLDKAITILLIGRNDYSVGILEYFSFLQWCQENQALKGYVIRNLDDLDGMNMIRSIINDVPEIVLQKIIKKSRGNPLFIIQFIEYLLEINIAHIINRNTIGVLNIDTFSTINYIPDAIEKLYNDKCKILKREQNGTELLNFLYVASFIGITFPKEVAILYFKEHIQIIQTIIERKFLHFSENGDIAFFHESIFLYFRNNLLKQSNILQKIWKEILKMSDFLKENDTGVAYFHLGEYSKAATCFENIINECKSMNNYSASNVKQEYYEYLDIIYGLAKINKDIVLQKKVIMYKIYTALHFYAPMIAVNESIQAEALVRNNSELMRDDMFLYSITELKAHGYLNAGQLKNSEQYFMECLTMSLLHPEKFADASKFDMYDRLAGLYIKYNHFLLAENYNKLSIDLAEKIGNDSLKSLSLITSAKLNLYLDPDKAEKTLNEAKALEKKETRTYVHIEISSMVQQLPIHMNNSEWIFDAKKRADKYRQLSIENGYSSSIIRSYLVLAALEIIESRYSCDYKKAKQFISCGIDLSIKYGIATYIWEFYNLKFIIASRLHEDAEYILKIVETMKRMLRQQNLFYLGTLDFCYANILVLTNIGKYLTHENEFYQFMSGISFNDGHYNNGCDFNCDNKQCRHVCEGVTDRFKLEFQQLKKNHLLLMDGKEEYSLIDEETGYFIALS